MRTVQFYRLSSGHCPIEEFLDSLNGKQAQKVIWVLRLIEEMEIVPVQYFKKLTNSKDLWEVRIHCGNDQYRLLCFIDAGTVVVLTNGFMKRYPDRKLHWQYNANKIITPGEKMSDLVQYIKKRSEQDQEFSINFEAGYADFKIGVILRQAREAAGLTQEQVAQHLNTKKSVISRIENHADDVRLSTLRRYAEAVGADLQIRFHSMSQ